MRFVRVALHRVAGLRKARPSDPAADRRSPLRSKRSARNVEAETFVHWKTVSSPSSYPVVRRTGRSSMSKAAACRPTTLAHRHLHRLPSLRAPAIVTQPVVEKIRYVKGRIQLQYRKSRPR